MRRFLSIIVAAVALIGCNETNKNQDITLAKGTSINQSVESDVASLPNGIEFTTNGAWEASVVDVTPVKAAQVEWLTLSQSAGKEAGTYKIDVTFKINDTKSERKAEIRITCGSSVLVITITQKASGTDKPADQSRFITYDGKITGGEIFGEKMPEMLAWLLVRGTDAMMDRSEYIYPYTNKNFDITLPTPREEYLGTLMDDNEGLTISPSSAKFISGVLDFSTGNMSLTNIDWKNHDNEDYLPLKGEGHIIFIYANTDCIVNGTYQERFDETVGVFINTYHFDQCEFRKGWNEMAIRLTQDVTSDGVRDINVTVNRTPDGFKWVAQNNKESVAHSPNISRINGREIEYADHNSIFSRVGTKNYVNKSPSGFMGNEWSYLSENITDGWSCYFHYAGQMLVDYTEYRSSKESTALVTKYEWNGNSLVGITDYNYNAGRNYGMTLRIEYGQTEYNEGTTDINWLIANGDYLGNRTFMTPEESAIGIMSIPNKKLISKIVLTDFGDDKYSATYEYRYEYDNGGYITKIYAKITGKSGDLNEERLIYEFEY